MIRAIDRRHLLHFATAVAGAALMPAPATAQDANKDNRPAPPALTAFARSPIVSNIALSPDGKRVAFASESNGVQKLVFFDVATMSPTTASVGDIKLRSLLWTDNEYLAFVESTTEHIREFGTGTYEFHRAHLVSTKELKIKNLLTEPGPYQNYNLLSQMPQRIRRNGRYQIIFGLLLIAGDLVINSDGTIEARDKEKRKQVKPSAAENSRRWRDLGHGKDRIVRPDGEPGAQLWMQNEDSPTKKVWQVSVQDKEANGLYLAPKKIFETSAVGVEMNLVGLGRDPDSFLITIQPEGEEARYHMLSRQGVLSEPLELGTKGDYGPLFHPSTWLLCGWSHHDDWFRYDYEDPLLKKLTEALPSLFPAGYRLSIVDFADDPRILLAYGEGPGDAGSYYHIDFTTGDVVELPQNFPDIPREWITQKQPIDYKAADGLQIHAYLTLPPFREAKNLPLVVLPHGGPQARDYGDFDWQAQALASRGYAVLQPNFRGSTGYGVHFVDAGHDEWGRKMQTDLTDGIAYLAGKRIIDKSRVAIVGASYGGYAALAGATLDQGVYRCAVSIAGVADVKTMLDYEIFLSSEGKHGETVKYWQKFLGDAKLYDDISPAQQADRAYCPILLIHGRDDTVVPFKQSDLMSKALKRAGKVYELIAYDNQDHWETIEASRIDMIEHVVAFLMQHNPA